MRLTFSRKRISIGLAVTCLIYLKFFWRAKIDWNIANNVDVKGRSNIEGTKYDKWIVVTTIQSPTDAMRKLAEFSDWKIVVVGDRTTPKNWRLKDVIYLDVAAQKALKYRIHDYLPYDSYTRKAIGYLFAIEHGAKFIYETDDDNIVENLNTFATERVYKGLIVDSKEVSFNPYPHFGQSSMWPRGYPLEYVGNQQPRKYHLCSIPTPVIQQGIVNCDPDVDALFRMTRQHNSSPENCNIKFDIGAPVVVLPYGTFGPYNSQNTLHMYRAFWALVFTTMVTDRETDIIRSYWAQKLLWIVGDTIAFCPSYTNQKRNVWHRNIKDAKEEYRLYTNMGSYVQYLQKWSCDKIFFFDCVLQLTNDLVMFGYWSKRDSELISAWLTDLTTVGYYPPIIPSARKHQTCNIASSVEVLFYPWEQNLTMPQKSFYECHISPDYMKGISTICGVSHQIYLQNATVNSKKFDDILLVITVYGDLSVIPVLDILYKIHFSHILYCGSGNINDDIFSKWKVSYIRLQNANPVTCVNEASKMKYNVAGYLHVTENILLQFEKLHVSKRNKDQMWVTGQDLYIFKETAKILCTSDIIHCASVNMETLYNLAERTKIVGNLSPKSVQYSKCIRKVGSDPTLKMEQVTASKELVFYIPQRLSTAFTEIVEFYKDDINFNKFEFLIIIILECIEFTPEYLHSTDIQDMGTVEHYDYVFPYVFRNVENIPNSDVHKIYCDYIQSH